MNSIFRKMAAVLLTAALLITGMMQLTAVYADEKPSVTFSELFGSLKEAVSEMDLPNGKDIYNVLLIGVDRRDESWYGNSDSIILLSVNKPAETIHIMSFMRDLGVEVPGHGNNKINYACAVGGPDLLIQTIEENFGVEIDNYAYTDFKTMAGLVDDLGGLTLELTDGEAEIVGTSAGTVLCTGDQVVTYARIRKIGNDYGRTERQRTVLKKIAEKMKEMDSTHIAKFVKDALSLVKHDMDAGTILSLAAQLPNFLNYEMVTSRVPYDDLTGHEGEKLMPTQPETSERIAKELNCEE